MFVRVLIQIAMEGMHSSNKSELFCEPQYFEALQPQF